MKTVRRRKAAAAVEPPPPARGVWRELGTYRSASVDRAPVLQWSERLAAKAHAALAAPGAYRAGMGSLAPRLAAVGAFYGLHDAHAFHAEPIGWLRAGEAQVTVAWANFLTAGGAPRILAFLRALDPAFPWPAGLTHCRARAEVPAGKGRIDILISAMDGAQMWGAVVEAKFGHNIDSNPLGDYVGRARKLGMRVGGARAAPATVIFRVVGPKPTRGIEKRLAGHPRWTFLAWATLLRRFEAEMQSIADDAGFRQCRRTTWERAL